MYKRHKYLLIKNIGFHLNLIPAIISIDFPKWNILIMAFVNCLCMQDIGRIFQNIPSLKQLHIYPTLKLLYEKRFEIYSLCLLQLL